MGDREPLTFVESAFRANRGAVFAVLLAVPIAAWIWVVLMARDMYGSMQGASAWMMTLVWDWPHVLLLWLMWAVMMTAMMMPAAAPLVLLYAAAARKQEDATRPAARIYALAGGYILVWALFSVGATALQRLLAGALVLTPMMEPATPVAGAMVLGIAGLYQLTPWKRACLSVCRSPLAFMLARSRAGIGGAFRLGLEHGAHCLGCCWAMMLILFAGGVMNLTVILALTVWVLVEKAMPLGDRTPVATGVALLAAAAWMLLR